MLSSSSSKYTESIIYNMIYYIPLNSSNLNKGENTVPWNEGNQQFLLLNEHFLFKNVLYAAIYLF